MMPGLPGRPPPPHYDEPPPPDLAGPPPTPGGYYYPYDSAQRQRKPVRAAQACDACRQRKAKCDEGRPECQHCKDNGLQCSYREIPPQKSEKQAIAITERLEGLRDSVDLLVANQKSQEAHNMAQDYKMQILIDFLMEQGQSYQPTDKEYAKNYTSVAAPSRPSPVHMKSEDSQEPTTLIADERTLRRNESIADDNSINFAMPLKHTTAVYNLFKWQSIKALLPESQSTSYVVDLETKRGLLRFCGCGEGEDKGDGHDGASSPAGSSSSEGRRMDEETSSASPRGFCGNGQFPLLQASSDSHIAREHPGGSIPRGRFMVDSEAVDRYFRAYMDHMHILHPFLEPKVLRQMVHAFKKKYSWDFGVLHAGIGAKRKREATNSPPPTSERDMRPQDRSSQARLGNTTSYTTNIEHSVTNAIVLLVIALGKLCTYRQPIPGPASTSAMHPSTPHTMHSALSDLPLPRSTHVSPFANQPYLKGNGPMAISSSSNPDGKNMDVTPGLSYFAIAADILGELPGGVDVSHIQANLLAALYMGQLARILPSHHYVSVACRACQILIESSEYKSGDMRPARRNLINFAFWSCLQLESDVLAEIELPPSGISRYESSQRLEIPTRVTLDKVESSDSEDILRFYSQQIQLRRTMNEVHTVLYEKTKQSKKPRMSVIETLNTNINEWRKMLKDWDWDDDDHQSENINVARMRAKYYGAKYIIYRPVLNYALRQANPPPTPDSKYSNSPETGYAIASPMRRAHSPPGRNHPASDTEPPGMSLGGQVDNETIAACKICVESAIRSTTAFDKVRRRLITTNIFGTAHP